jgi:hypothetical protein
LPAQARRSCYDSTADAITQHAQTFRGEQFDRADLIVWCTAPDFDETARAVDARLLHALRQQDRPLLIVRTKADMGQVSNLPGPEPQTTAGYKPAPRSDPQWRIGNASRRIHKVATAHLLVPGTAASFRFAAKGKD